MKRTKQISAKGVLLFVVFYIIVSALMTFFLYRIFVDDLPVPFETKMFILAYFLITMFIGMATWKAFRVVTYLLLPKLCSDQGRAILLTLMLYVAFTGPLINIYKNLGVMAQILTCEIHEVKSAFHDMMDLIRDPIVYIRHLVDNLVMDAKNIFFKFSDTLVEIQQGINHIMHFVKIGIDFVKNIKNLCKSEIGTPFSYCTKMVQKVIEDCEEEQLSIVCAPLAALHALCIPFTALDLFCMDFDLSFMQFGFVEYLTSGFRYVTDEMGIIFDVNVTIDGDFEMVTNQSLSWDELKAAVIDDFVERTKFIFIGFNVAKMAALAFSFFIVLSTLYFKYRYLASVHYKNRYLTKTFHEIDEMNIEIHMTSIFPLNHKERSRYISLFSPRLTGWEVAILIKSLVIMLVPCVQVAAILVGDHALYNLLVLIAESSQSKNIEIPKVLNVNIKGSGMVADLMTSLFKLFDPIINGFKLDFGHCVPDPHPPNTAENVILICLAVSCLAAAIIQPYMLRMKHVVMERYFPFETRTRARWLYNDIKQKRTNMFQLVVAKFKTKSEDNKHISCIDFLRAKTNDHFLCRSCLGFEKKETCASCAQPINMKNEESYYKCVTVTCLSLYCTACTTHLDKTCLVCQQKVVLAATHNHLLNLVVVDSGSSNKKQ